MPIVGNDHLRLAARARCIVNSRATRLPEIEVSGIVARHTPRHIIDNVEDAEAPALGELVMDEVERPARVDLGLDQDRRARSDRFPPSLALADWSALLRGRADRCG